jgi:galactokinase
VNPEPTDRPSRSVSPSAGPRRRRRATATPGPADGARRLFHDRMGAAPAVVAFGPGRVNLIGEHTDYNDGFVLPMALERGVAVACRARPDRRIRAYAAQPDETQEIPLDALAPGRVAGWLAYVAGVAWALERAGCALPGFDLVLTSDLPIGAGLSSSAALEVATARAIAQIAARPWDPMAMAPLCQQVENEFVGMPCGLMDQLASAASREGSATLLDCRSLETTFVPVPAAAAVVVMDTGVRRALVQSAYAERRAACEAAVTVLRTGAPQVRALRDVDQPMLDAARARLDPVVFQRASHVVAENVRPPAMAAALGANDLAAAGRLMNDSHVSLRDLYEVSCPELDLVCELARGHPACFGARMTGAGFGGCAVALVRREGGEAFVREIEQVYRARGPSGEPFFVTRPGGGARVVD